MRNRSSLKTFLAFAASAGFLAGSILGCAGTTTAKGKLTSLPAEKAKMMAYYLPTQIEILPFTKPASFDACGLPDGINAVVRPLDTLGQAVKAYGTMRFETLYLCSGQRPGQGQAADGLGQGSQYAEGPA